MAVRSSFSSFSYVFSYDVFLSFRGSDTRYGFASNLWKSLRDRGIHTFIDDEELQRGDEITLSLVKAIQGSRIAIPIFSKNYASSSFCLDELVKIIECVKAEGRLVLPVFCDVDPSHVRHQTGSYGEALAKHRERFAKNKEKLKENMERLGKWKMALTQAANLSGYHFKLGNEYEHEFREKIVKVVSSKINRIPLHVVDYPVGLESRVLRVKSLLEFESKDGVHMIGIYGIGGVGKTTLARAVYNFVADHFEGLCFLHNVRENSLKHGLECLQETILSEIIGEDIKIGCVSKGISVIKHRLHQKKVLLILDDVDKLEQLHVMAGGLDWFGSGSRVIITTRDKHLLASHGVERKYEVDSFNQKEALDLLCWNAFKDDKIDPSFMYILNRAINYASGLPLALEIIGSNMFRKSIGEWKSVLDQYERVPNKKIQNILQVSFDALEEEEKSVFLDIACCFKGYELAEVEKTLHVHHSDCMKHHIGVLVEKSLIKIGNDGEVTLHDLIEDMGKEIVRRESPREPGKRSRLWFPRDIVEVLEENVGSGEIEIIYLNFSLYEEAVVEWDGEAFKKMTNLKTLIIKNGHFSKGPKHLPNNLRVLEWWRYPSQHLPSDFHLKKLGICKLPYSRFTSLELAGSVKKKFANMRVLNFDSCQYLTHIRDVSGLPNLEEFSFRGCRNLITIHYSVGLLGRLKILSADGCKKLKSFPPLKLISLEQLELSYCHSLKSFPEILEKMENITELRLYETPIKELPLSFRNLNRLQKLKLNISEVVRLPSFIAMMPELAVVSAHHWEGWLPKKDEGEEKVSSTVSSNVKCLRLRQCNLSNDFLPIGLKWFANVQELDLSQNIFTIIPECIKGCTFLWKLVLNNCTCLQEIRGIPPNIEYFSAVNCISLTSSCKSMLLNQEIHEAGYTTFSLPGATCPEWFEHQSTGKSISFWFRNRFPALVLCLVSSLTWRYSEIVVIINGNKFFFTDAEFCSTELCHTYLVDMQMEDFSDDYAELLIENEWNHAKVIFKGYILTEIGIHVLKQKNSLEDIRFTYPYRKRESNLIIDLNSPPLPEKPKRLSSWNDVNTQLTL